MELIIASLNTNKVHELRECLKELIPSLQVISLFDFSATQQLMARHDAKCDSFEENAKIKALHAAKALNKPCIADDSGIVIPAFGKVGVSLTRRYDTQTDSFTMQTKKLLQEMRGFKDLERQAYLECSLAFAHPNGTTHAVTQRMEGFITEEERGKMSLDFDTIFIKHDYNQTLGQLPESVRKRITHRRKALERLSPVLERLLCTTT